MESNVMKLEGLRRKINDLRVEYNTALREKAEIEGKLVELKEKLKAEYNLGVEDLEPMIKSVEAEVDEYLVRIENMLKIVKEIK